MKLLAFGCALAVLTAATAVAGTNPRSEKLRLTDADIFLAKRIAVRQADIGPGWQQAPTRTTNDDYTFCPSFQPDFSRFTVTGKAISRFRFETTAEIVSAVAVFKTIRQAIGDFRLGAKPALAACFAEQVRSTFRTFPRGVVGKLLSSRMVPAPRLGNRSAAYAIVARISGQGVALRIFVDVVAFQRGRSMVALLFTGVGSRVPSQRSLAQAVVARMR